MRAELTEKQSRIGKQPVPVPSGVQVKVDGRKVSLKGPKGEAQYVAHETVDVAFTDGAVRLAPKKGSGKRGTQFSGLARAELRNAVQGVAEGYKLALDFHGVGYRAELKGQDLTLALGLSHPVQFPLPKSVKGRVEIIDEGGIKRPRLHLESHDKSALGQTAARIRAFRPPEPYKGKGVRYLGEKIREKAGKAGKGATTA